MEKCFYRYRSNATFFSFPRIVFPGGRTEIAFNGPSRGQKPLDDVDVAVEEFALKNRILVSKGAHYFLDKAVSVL